MKNGDKNRVLNIVKQAVAQGVAFMTYIRGRGVRAGLSREQVEVLIGELLAEDRLEEKVDPNGVVWFHLKPEVVTLDWQCPVCGGNHFIETEIPSFRGNKPMEGMRCTSCKRTFLKDPPKEKDPGKATDYRHIHTEHTRQPNKK